MSRCRDDVGSASLRDDVGSASLWIVAFAMIMLAAAGSTGVVGGAIADRHRAATAADLAALAGAAAVARATAGGGSPELDELRAIGCAAAGRIAGANAAHLISCDVTGTTVAVTASVALSRLARVAALAGGSVSARARAGPG